MQTQMHQAWVKEVKKRKAGQTRRETAIAATAGRLLKAFEMRFLKRNFHFC